MTKRRVEKRRKQESAARETLSPDERRAILLDIEPGNPVWQAWLALSPGERLLRAWERRRFLLDPGAVHDARSLPEL